MQGGVYEAACEKARCIVGGMQVGLRGDPGGALKCECECVSVWTGVLAELSELRMLAYCLRPKAAGWLAREKVQLVRSGRHAAGGAPRRPQAVQACRR